MLGIWGEETPQRNFLKICIFGQLDYVIALNKFDRHRLTGFGVARPQTLNPPIYSAHRPYYTKLMLPHEQCD